MLTAPFKMYSPGINQKAIICWEDGKTIQRLDKVVAEEPLEIIIRLKIDKKTIFKTISITMRTPGLDEKLCLGFLFNEGIIDSKDDVISIDHRMNCSDLEITNQSIILELKPNLNHRILNLNRHFYTTSSCGVCGKTAIDLAITSCHYIPKKLERSINPSTLGKLPELLKKEQILFHLTGGIHACGIFNLKNELIYFAEDVGRHNALDKVAGWCLENQLLPMSDHILILSGRASFELIQKAMCMGIPVICSVGAPSSLAIELAESQGITLIGFLKSNKMNIYSGYFRLESE